MARFERALLSVMGPPQLGDPDEPAPALAPPPAGRCPKCRTSYEHHEVVRDPGLTYLRCPPVD